MQNIIVLFEATIKEREADSYLESAGLLREELSKAEGLISAERFSSLVVENKILSISEWKDEISITKWRNNIKHRKSQKYGRMSIFENYKITVVNPIRSYTINIRDNAPLDSNEYFGL